MAVRQPGEEISYVVTWLEMAARPSSPIPPTPAGPLLALIRAEGAPAHYFLYLYRAVGADFEWTDWLERGEDEVRAFVDDAKVELFTLFVDGWPGGFFVLDTREEGICDLAYFGLVPEARGRGLARWLLASAVHAGWDRPGVDDGEHQHAGPPARDHALPVGRLHAGEPHGGDAHADPAARGLSGAGRRPGCDDHYCAFPGRL